MASILWGIDYGEVGLMALLCRWMRKVHACGVEVESFFTDR